MGVKAGSLVVAGGNVAPGLRTMLCALDSPGGRRWRFGPASMVQLFGRGPGLQLAHDSRRGALHLKLTDWRRGRRLHVDAHAEPATFSSFYAPMPEGHREAFCHESMHARYDVRLEERRWTPWPTWTTVEGPLVLEDEGALEFGGSWSHWAEEAHARSVIVE
jgi:hypothetical protein